MLHVISTIRYQFLNANKIASAICTGAILFFASCSVDDAITDDTFYHLGIPEGFPYPVIPDDNPLTAEKVELGKALFFDKDLSADSTISCADCHQPEYAFSDHISLSKGVQDRTGRRNAPSLTNIGYSTSLLRDGAFSSLEMQMPTPLQDHNEMDYNMAELIERLTNDDWYRSFFMRVFGNEPDAFGITRAIASFERTLISGNSKYDKALRAEPGVFFTESELQGYNLFTGNVLNCSKCHSGFNFTDNSFQNNGLYTDYSNDEGRAEITGLNSDIGKFRVPTLRNIAITGPYMHDGSVYSLHDVIRFYASGGSDHINKNTLISGFSLSAEEEQNLIDFLNTLTDEDFISNADHSQH